MGGGGGETAGRIKREGICVYIWLIHFIVQQKPTQHGKATITQLKKESWRQERKAQETVNLSVFLVFPSGVFPQFLEIS